MRWPQAHIVFCDRSVLLIDERNEKVRVEAGASVVGGTEPPNAIATVS